MVAGILPVLRQADHREEAGLVIERAADVDKGSFYKGVVGHSAVFGEQEVDICKCCGGADEHTDHCIVPAIEEQIGDLENALFEVEHQLERLTKCPHVMAMVEAWEEEEAERADSAA